MANIEETNPFNGFNFSSLSEIGIEIKQPQRLSFTWLDFSDPNTQKEVDKWHMHINDAKAILKDKDSLIQDLENLI